MGDEIMVVPDQVIAVGFVRLRAGALPGPNGEANPADFEAVISLQMGCVRAGSLVGADGKQMGHMVPVGEVSRPLGDIKAEAAMRFNMREQSAEQALAVRQ